MRSIKASFNKVSTKNPDWSSYVCFSKAIEGKYFCEDTIRRGFNKLVKKEDYFNNKITLLNQLVKESKNHLRTTYCEPNFNSKALKINIE